MALIQTVHLSMANFKSAPVVPAVQNDTDRQVKMIIDDYTLTSGLTGKIAFERSDGTHYETAAELVLADNAFTADIDQALTQPGRTMVQLKVTDTLTVSTFSFVIFVESDYSGTVTPQESIDLVTAVEAAESAADRAESAAEDAEESAASVDADAIWDAIDGINDNLSDGVPTLMAFSWTNGENWKSGNDVLTATILYRVCNSAPFTYPHDLTITHPGLYMKLYMDTNHDNTFATTVSWLEEPYTIPANTPTYISLKRINEDTSETANIAEFVGELKISPILTNEKEFQEVKQIVYASDYVNASADTVMTGKYVRKDGVIVDLAKYTILCFNLDKNDVIKVISSKGITDATEIAYMSVWKDGVFQYVYGDAVDGTSTMDIFIASTNCEFRVVTKNNDSSYTYSFYKSKYALALTNYIDKTLTGVIEKPTLILSAFENLTCIGDSLTWSQVYTGSSSSRQAFKPYPKVIESLTGVSATILATAGYSAIDCWNEYNDEIIQKNGQIAIIYLGTNGGLTDTIATDMPGDDYTQWANTNTGCYGKLIAKLLSVNSRVVLVKVHSSSGNVATTNSVIEQMASKFNVPYIDNDYLPATKYHSYPNGGGTNGTHYNDIGYTVFAQQVIDKINALSDADILKILPQ